jgi:phenylacetate-CoA ligase
MEVQIEVQPSFFPDAMRKLVEFERHAEDKLQEELGVRARVKLVEPRKVPRYTGKARRVFDRR